MHAHANVIPSMRVKEFVDANESLQTKLNVHRRHVVIRLAVFGDLRSVTVTTACFHLSAHASDKDKQGPQNAVKQGGDRLRKF